MFGALQDITDRKHAELALAASEERLRLAQELGGVGSFDWDNVRDDSEVSDVLRQILGLPPDLRVSRQSHAPIIYPDDLATFDAAIDAAIPRSKDFDVEYRIIRPVDQELRWIHIRGGVIRSEGQRVCKAGVIKLCIG